MNNLDLNKPENLEKLKDKKFYLENFCKIKGKKPGSLIPFILNDAQKDLFNAVRRNNRVIILKSRQIGFSTAMVGYFYVDTIMNPGTTTAIIGYNSDLTAELLDKVKTFYRTTPVELRPTRHFDSKYEISFPTINSKILVLPSTVNVGRGYTITNCLDKDTEIVMEDNSCKKICKIVKGDVITNGNGGLSKVEDVLKRSGEDKEMLSLSVYGNNKNLEATSDHKIFVRGGVRCKGVWKKAGELKKGDMIGYPLKQSSRRREYNIGNAKEEDIVYGEDHYWVRIRDIKKIKTPKYVYDIVLKNEPHSFLTTSGVVHNCLATELSSWEDAEEKMMTLEASVPIEGKLVIESCVTGDTIIFTEDGPRRMKDIHDWKNNKLGFSEGTEILVDGHYGLQPTTTYYNSGVKKGFRFITKHGYELGMSSVHKLFVLRGDKLEFVKSKDMKVGDLLAIKYGQEIWGKNDKVNWEPTPYKNGEKYENLFNPKVVTRDLAYLVGVLLGDGYVTGKYNHVVITNTDKEIVEFLLDNKLGLKFRKGVGENYYHYTCSNKSFIEFLQEHIGFEEGVKAPGKKIYDIILGWSRENVIVFLQGLFDTDGSCRKDRGMVSFTSTSKEMINTLKVLLLNFGIISYSYVNFVKPTKLVEVSSVVYVLELSRSHSNIFLEKIGFRVKRKYNNGKKLKECHSCLQEFIPGMGKIIKGSMKELGLRYSDVSCGLNKGFYSKSGNMTYRTLGRILEKCKNKESNKYKEIKKLYENKYFYDEIKEIIPIEENVYDFTIENGHTVNYSGIIGHQTPRGQGNLYHKMWMSDNDYVKKEYGWHWGYSKEEIKMIKRRMNNPQKFAQEYGLEFLASGRPVFDSKAIQKQRKNVLKLGDVVEEDGRRRIIQDDHGLVMYREPEDGNTYSVGVDTSEGVEGGDYSVVTMWNKKTGEEVASFRGLLPPDILASRLNKWGRKYNNALMVVEVNNHGLTTITELKKMLYPSLYFRKAQFDTIGSAMTDKLGWKTTIVTRTVLIDDFSQALRENAIIIHTKKLLDEMTVFVYDDNGRMVPMGGFHDDCVFSAGIGLQGLKELHDKPLTQLDYSSYLPSGFSY